MRPGEVVAVGLPRELLGPLREWLARHGLGLEPWGCSWRVVEMVPEGARATSGSPALEGSPSWGNGWSVRT